MYILYKLSKINETYRQYIYEQNLNCFILEKLYSYYSRNILAPINTLFSLYEFICLLSKSFLT